MSQPVVLFPPADTVVIAGLTAGRTSQGWSDGPINGEIPRPRPTGLFTTVRRTGGPRRNIVVDAAQITIDSWADTWADAADLAERNRALFHAMRGDVVDGATVCRTGELSGPGKLPDPESAQARYRQNFTIDLRGSAP